MPDTSTPEKGTFELINELIIAVSHLLWPILAFVVIFMFKTEISALLRKIKKGKLFGQEIELDEEINQFKAITNEASLELPLEQKQDVNTNNDNIENIIEKGGSDPKIAIFLLSIEIEKEITSLIASTGLLKNFRVGSIKSGFELLASRDYVSKSTMKSVEIFWDLRNRIVHGKEVEDEGRLLRVLDIGVELYNTLKAIPHQKVIIGRTNIQLYSNKECTIKREDGFGVEIIRKTSDGIATNSIFPTTKTDYQTGTQVSWEWSFSKIWGQTWIKDPETSEVTEVWFESAEFTGRKIQDI